MSFWDKIKSALKTKTEVKSDPAEGKKPDDAPKMDLDEEMIVNGASAEPQNGDNAMQGLFEIAEKEENSEEAKETPAAETPAQAAPEEKGEEKKE